MLSRSYYFITIMQQKILTLLTKLAHELSPVYEHPSEQQQTAWWLLQALTEKSEAQLLAQQEIKLTEEQEQQLNRWIDEHVNQRKPLQYILGSTPFDGLLILCEPPTLIPRPETEELTINLAEKLTTLAKPLTVLDLATGTGCIALALAKRLPQANIYATDISEKALDLAKRNAKFNTINNVTFMHSDVFNNIPKNIMFDIIISNPPYISAEEYKKLAPSVAEWEDKKALVAEHDGFAIIEEIIKEAPNFIRFNENLFLAGIPQVIIEIGYRQGNRAKELMQKALYTNVKVEQDLEGKDRVIVGRVPRATGTGPTS